MRLRLLSKVVLMFLPTFHEVQRRLAKQSVISRSMRHLALLLLVLLTCGCTETISKAGLDAKARERVGFTFPDETYYVGSDNRYDHFVIRRGLGGSTHRYRVRQSEGSVTNRFNITKDETRWRGYGITGVVVTNRQVVVP